LAISVIFATNIRLISEIAVVFYLERLAFATSDEGKNYLFPLGLTLDGKRYETKASGGAVKAFHEESRTRTTSSGPAAASARPGRWLLRR